MDEDIEYGDETAEYGDEQLDKEEEQATRQADKQAPVIPSLLSQSPIAPVSLPEPVVESVESSEPAESSPRKSSWQWIGDSNRPEARKSSDGISDLFEVDNSSDTEDVVSVDVERDIVDADEDGSLDSLVTVTEEDIMGYGPYNQPKKHKSTKVQRRSSQDMNTRLGGLR